MAFQRQLFQTTVPSSPRQSSVLLQISGTSAMSSAAPTIRKAMVLRSEWWRPSKRSSGRTTSSLPFCPTAQPPIPTSELALLSWLWEESSEPPCHWCSSHESLVKGSARAWRRHEAASEGRLRSSPWSAASPGTKSRQPSSHQNGWREGLEVAGRGGEEVRSTFILGTDTKRSPASEPPTSETDPSICVQSRWPPSPEVEAVFSPDHTVRQEPYPTVFWPAARCIPGWAARDTSDRPTTITTAVSREHFIFIDAAYTRLLQCRHSLQCLQPHPFAPDMAASSISLPDIGDFVCSVVPWEHKCVVFHCALRAQVCSFPLCHESTFV